MRTNWIRSRDGPPPLKVLVVDDEPPIRKLLRMGLTSQGYNIVEASNGKAALELMREAPDLNNLDLAPAGYTGT